MRLTIMTITGLLLASFAHAQSSVESFRWQTNSRFELAINQKSGPVLIKGDLRDGARQSYPSKDGQMNVEIKSYTTELFVVIAVTTENDETGYISILERPQSEWLVMNDTPIRARKIDLMNDFETAVKDFKVVTNHTFANVLRKMVEYFEKYPNKRMQDLLSALETKDPFLAALPRPRAVAKNNDQGVIPGRTPRDARQTAERDPNGPPTTPPPDGIDDDQQPAPRVQPRRQAQVAPRDPNDQNDEWVQAERDRQQRLRRERRARQLREQQMREQQGYDDGYGPRPQPYYPRGGGYDPRQQYRPQPQQPRGGFFDNFFGQ